MAVYPKVKVWNMTFVPIRISKNIVVFPSTYRVVPKPWVDKFANKRNVRLGNLVVTAVNKTLDPVRLKDFNNSSKMPRPPEEVLAERVESRKARKAIVPPAPEPQKLLEILEEPKTEDKFTVSKVTNKLDTRRRRKKKKLEDNG